MLLKTQREIRWIKSGERFKMNKVLLVLCSFILFSSLASAVLPLCSDTNEIDLDDIPCQGLTPVVNCSANFNVTLLNLNTSVETNISGNQLANERVNFTLNLSEGTYSLVDCSNNSATIIVGDFPRDDLWKTAVILGLLGMAFIIMIQR